MTTLTGKLIANTYKDLLQISNSNSGIDATLRNVEDGEGTTSPLQLSNSAVNLTGTIQLQGQTLTATASVLNNVADLTGTTGIVVGDSGTLYGRSIAVGGPLSVTNANGVAGNPTITMGDSGVSASTYGPMNSITVDVYGRITDVSAVTTISANAFVGGTLSGSSLYVENNVSVSGSMNIASTLDVGSNATIDGNLTSQNITTSIVSATYLYGDGSNITGLPGSGTMKQISAGTGISFTENAAPIADISVSGTINISSNQTFAVVTITDRLAITSAASFPDNAKLNFGDSNDLQITHNGSHSLISEAGTGNLFIQSNEIRLTNTGAFSMLTLADGQDADFPYGVQVSGTVSASGFVGPTITSINSTIANVSAYATSIKTDMATSIDNTNTNLTALSATMATSIDNVNTNITALSATMATSIGNTNTNLTAVSAYSTSIVEALSATMATSIANHLPLAGGTMTGALTLNGAPSSNLEAATKLYVDNLTSAAIHFHEPVRVESPDSAGNLNATYDNGASGVGATLTNAGTQAALVIDGITLNTNDRVLIYNQTDATENGVYTVTDTGSASTNWVLTRATDADSYEPNDNTGIDGGSYFYIQEGNSGAGEAYVCNNVGTITIGTTDITFVQFSSALVYTAGSGININSSRVVSTSGVPTDAELAAVSAYATSITTALSATMATSIGNSNTNITTLSATMATSIGNTNSNITSLSATMATSIANAAGGAVAFAIALG